MPEQENQVDLSQIETENEIVSEDSQETTPGSIAELENLVIRSRRLESLVIEIAKGLTTRSGGDAKNGHLILDYVKVTSDLLRDLRLVVSGEKKGD